MARSNDHRIRSSSELIYLCSQQFSSRMQNSVDPRISHEVSFCSVVQLHIEICVFPVGDLFVVKYKKNAIL